MLTMKYAGRIEARPFDPRSHRTGNGASGRAGVCGARPSLSNEPQEDKWVSQGLERISEWKHQVAPIPLVSIGGPNLTGSKAFFEAGAESAAVVTDFARNDAPEARTREWIERQSNGAEARTACARCCRVRLQRWGLELPATSRRSFPLASEPALLSAR